MNEQQEPKEEHVEAVRPRGMQIVGAGLLILAVGLSLSYGWWERSQAKEMAASREGLMDSLTQTQAQVNALTGKLNTLSAAQAAAQAQSAAGEEKTPPEKAKPHSAARASLKHQTARHVDDPRWKQVQTEIAENQKQIQDTQASVDKARADLEGSLSSTRDELSGSIARNHDELVELEKRGQRNYTEFNLSRSKQFQTVGPVSVSLRKANTKHEYCDLEMLVNDSQLSKKHVNLYEPVLLYPQGHSQPLEIVINEIGKDSARGYLSEPKYKQPEPATSAAASAPAASTPAPTPTLARREPSEQ